jgi:hypothetical protein
MSELRKIHREAVPKALERVERYRLLNHPRVAESIARDILAVDAENQQALVGLILALTDQFEMEANTGINPVLEIVQRLDGEYAQAYYAAIVYERQAVARLKRCYPGANFDAFELLQKAMELFIKGDQMSLPEDDDAILHWNACVRMVDGYKLRERPREDASVMSE